MAVGGEILTKVKITDFGIAKMAEDELAEAVEREKSLTASQTAIGALPYMAPEMFQSVRDAGKPADIWSLGAMMFELLTGKKAFGSGLKAVPKILEAKLATAGATSRFKPQFRPAADEIFSIINACVKKDPAARLAADDLVHRCEALCYPITPLELGTIKVFDNGYWGFASADAGTDVFVHLDSIPISYMANVGDRVVFARHKGGGNDRAYPVLPLARS
jgi:eukaryotic-like serine/threonine-protein kinase